MLLRGLILLTLMVPIAWGFSDKCRDALESLFQKKVGREEAGDFLKLQGDLTLHRMTWLYLKAQQKDENKRIESSQKVIQELLNRKYTSTDKDFIKARDAFEKQPLSRKTLARIGPYLKEALAKEFPEEDQPYLLNASDIKLLDALGSFEKLSSNGLYDHRMLSRKSPQGMLNFLKLINSSYKTSLTPEEERLQIDFRLQGLEQNLAEMQERMNEFFEAFDLPLSCEDELLCSDGNKDLAKLFEQNEEVQNILWESLKEKLLDDDALLDNLTYGNLWVRVGKVVPGKKKNPPSVNRKLVPKKHSEVVKTFFSSSTGLILENPLTIILKDRPGRDAKIWNSYSRIFKEKMADAIVKDEKVFALNGKIYSRETGRAISPAQALEILKQPKKQALYKSYLTSKDPKFIARQVEAMINKRESFMFSDKLYNLQGEPLAPDMIISAEVTKATGVPHFPSQYEGMDGIYLASRAHALMNNLPHFRVNRQVYDSQTGRSITSPFRSLATTQDVRVEKEKRKLYQSLGDKEKIINFHRDQANKSGCQHYTIVDKKEALMTVHALDGKEIYRNEILLGVKVSDQRTRWTKYGEREKQTNFSSGAGVYTIAKPKLNNVYYSRVYSNNILQLEQDGKEQVLAIHQVPNGMGERYASFGTGYPSDRRVSNGCLNLKLSDYNKVKKWLQPSCQVYVLPEEEGNHFVVRNGQINFTSSRKMPIKEVGLYNFNFTREAKPISIRITEEAGRTEEAEIFVKTLAEEKDKLMRIFKIDNDDYNDLAALSYALMGNESDFGRSKKLWLKENLQFGVIATKALTGHPDRVFSSEHSNTSRGYTQIKFLPEGEWQKHYPDVSKESLMNPKHSAIASMAYLVEAMKIMKTIAEKNKQDSSKLKISREDLVEYLGYLYMGRKNELLSEAKPASSETSSYLQKLREFFQSLHTEKKSSPSVKEPVNPDRNLYIQKLRKHMSFLEIAQKFE